jgi:hypothetical protein
MKPPRSLRTTLARSVALIAALAGAAGCPAEDPDEGLAVFNVTVDSRVPAFARLVFTVKDRADLPERVVAGMDRVVSFGYYLPGVNGTVTVVGEARTEAGCTVGKGSQSATVQPGQISAAVSLIIAPSAEPCPGVDAGAAKPDAAMDASTPDALAPDATMDVALPDAQAPDAQAPDAQVPDAPPADASTAGPNNGDTCTSGDTCRSGHCVDGVCCESACGGQCESCNLPGQRGLCAVAPMGDPPIGRPRCAGQGMICGGTCDGSNRSACRFPAGETACKAAGCTSHVAAAPSYCDGRGACNLQLKIQCADSVVCDHEGDGGLCVGSCKQDVDCGGPDTFCEASNCFMKSPTLGWGCRGDNQCGSGHCVDGVCCESSCDGACQACNVVGQEGHCKAVVSADDDHCRGATTCDAAGACKQRAGTGCTLATACASGACVDGHCCQVGACGTCESCTGGGGTCVKVVNTQDPDTCATPLRCNFAGVCQ